MQNLQLGELTARNSDIFTVSTVVDPPVGSVTSRQTGLSTITTNVGQPDDPTSGSVVSTYAGPCISRGISKLAAHNSCISIREIAVAHCTPHSTVMQTFSANVSIFPFPKLNYTCGIFQPVLLWWNSLQQV